MKLTFQWAKGKVTEEIDVPLTHLFRLSKASAKFNLQQALESGANIEEIKVILNAKN